MSITSLDTSAALHIGTGHGRVLAADCPSRAVLQHVTSRWGLLVLLVLLKGTRRFSELRRSIDGVSEKMLAQSLQALEKDGFVLRHSHDEVPPRVDYSLTSIGVEVAQHVEALADWIEANMPRIGQLGDGRSAHESRQGANACMPGVPEPPEATAEGRPRHSPEVCERLEA